MAVMSLLKKDLFLPNLMKLIFLCSNFEMTKWWRNSEQPAINNLSSIFYIQNSQWNVKNFIFIKLILGTMKIVPETCTEQNSLPV